jgi:hypothetical protein
MFNYDTGALYMSVSNMFATDLSEVGGGSCVSHALSGSIKFKYCIELCT